MSQEVLLSKQMSQCINGVGYTGETTDVWIGILSPLTSAGQWAGWVESQLDSNFCPLSRTFLALNFGSPQFSISRYLFKKWFTLKNIYFYFWLCRVFIDIWAFL